jgi:hypothetical protein
MAPDDGSWPPPTTDDRKAFRGGSNGKWQEIRVDQCVRIERRGSGSSVGMGHDCARAAGAVLGGRPEVHMAPSTEAMTEDLGARHQRGGDRSLRRDREHISRRHHWCDRVDEVSEQNRSGGLPGIEWHGGQGRDRSP